MALSPSELRDRFSAAAVASGCGWTPLDEGQPMTGNLTLPSGGSLSLVVYLRNVTHGGGAARPANEFRIQVANLPPPITDPPGSTRLVLGWFEELSVFAGFDSARHYKDDSSPSSVQIGLGTLTRAHDLGFATQSKGGGDVACAFVSDRLGSYAADPDAVHGYAPASEPSAAEDADDIIAAAVRPRRASGQGLQQNHAARLATEQHAMQVATALLAGEGWTVTDVSKTASYDLRCVRGHDELRVEVKGTTGLGVTVLLTANEVAHAVDHHPQTCLIVVSGIELSADDPPIGAGGQIRRIDAWEPAKDGLKAVTYAYRVPDDG